MQLWAQNEKWNFGWNKKWMCLCWYVQNAVKNLKLEYYQLLFWSKSLDSLSHSDEIIKLNQDSVWLKIVGK